MTVNLQPVTILSDNYLIQGVYSRSGNRIVNFIGGFTRSRYGKPRGGEEIQTVLEGVFKLRLRSGAETSLAVEATEEELPFFDKWVHRELGSQAVWDKNAESEVWSLLTENTANPSAFPTRSTEHWHDETGIYRLNKQLTTFDCEIASESTAASGETFYNVKVTEKGVTRYVHVAFNQLQMGEWSNSVSREACITDGIQLFMILTDEWNSRTPEERRKLQIAQLRFEQQASAAAFDKKIARL